MIHALSENRNASSAAWWRSAARRLAPGAVFALFLAYQWRIVNLAGAVPGYGDVLENVWAIDWFCCPCSCVTGTLVGSAT